MPPWAQVLVALGPAVVTGFITYRIASRSQDHQDDRQQKTNVQHEVDAALKYAFRGMTELIDEGKTALSEAKKALADCYANVTALTNQVSSAMADLSNEHEKQMQKLQAEAAAAAERVRLEAERTASDLGRTNP